MTRVDKIKLKGWRSQGRQFIGTVERRNSQIGQLLYYLVAVQLQQIQLYLSPTEREFEHNLPTKTLGLFIEEGKVSKQGLGHDVQLFCLLHYYEPSAHMRSEGYYSSFVSVCPVI